MKKLLKNWILYLILSILVLGFGAYLIYDTRLGHDLSSIFVGIGVVIYTVGTLYPSLKKYNNATSKLCLLLEFLIDLVIGVMMIIDQNGAKYLPFLIYLRGFNILLVRYISKKSGDPAYYFLGIFLVTAGTYIYCKNLIGAKQLYYGLLGMVFLAGLLLVYLCIKFFKEKK